MWSNILADGFNKSAIRRDLEAQGNWAAFVKRREGLKSIYSPDDAWVVAATEFGAGDHVEPQRLARIGQEPVAEAKEPAGPTTRQKRDIWGEMAATAKGKESDALSDLTWVFNNIPVDERYIDPTTAPSTGAVGLLKHVRDNPAAMGEFYKSIWPRILPSKQMIENSQKKYDDGREVTDLIDRISVGMTTENRLDWGDGE